MDWYNTNDNLRKAKIITENGLYNIEMPFGKIVKIVTDGNTLVWPEDELNEVVLLKDNSFTAQGEGKGSFYVACGGNVKECVLDFSKSSMQEQKI